MAERYEYQFPEIYEANTFDRWVYQPTSTEPFLAACLVELEERRIPPLDFDGASVLIRFRKFESEDPWQSYRVNIRCEVSYEARKEAADG